jgi:hypothetical protein
MKTVFPMVERFKRFQQFVAGHTVRAKFHLKPMPGRAVTRSAVTRPFMKRAALVGAQCRPRVFYEALKNLLLAGLLQARHGGRSKWDWLVREER